MEYIVLNCDSWQSELFSPYSLNFMPAYMHRDRILPGVYMYPFSVDCDAISPVNSKDLGKVSKLSVTVKRRRNLVDLPHKLLVTNLTIFKLISKLKTESKGKKE